MEKTTKTVERATSGMERTAETMADTVLAIMDKLAGKESDIKLSFENLTLDMGMMKTTLNGAIVLDVIYSKEAEGTTASKTATM